MRTIQLLFILAISMVATAANGQDKSNDTTTRYFIIQASISNLQEIEIGRLAAKQAVSPDVKAFGQRMVADHSKAQAELVQLISARGFQIPHEATDKPVEDPMLKNMPGKDFDRMYVDMMVPDHRQAVQLFGNYALTGKDPDVRAFAKRILPVLKEHLASITTIDNGMKGAAAN